MNPSPAPAVKITTRTLLSTLWIAVVLNMLAADVLSLYIPGAADELNAIAGAMPIPTLMLAAAFIFEIPIALIVLSRVLKRGPGRWANILGSLITMLFVVGGGASFPHYIFIATFEVLCMLAILWRAWTWPAVEE